MTSSRPRSSALRAPAASADSGSISVSSSATVTDTPGTSEPRAGALEQHDALVLELLAVIQLGLEHAGQRHDALDVAVADRGALLEHHSEQPPGGDELGFEMRDHLVGQGGVGLG